MNDADKEALMLFAKACDEITALCRVCIFWSVFGALVDVGIGAWLVTR